ncbi:hypothetical protein B296_00041320 [Ensete ventricosum]|uniref:Uncharacterized protein n=1 Tax=Ensete ventricosum TaxID=4639 RepID=A0A426X8Q7_ENSVE|nr:hypothetical protein B296_00041320 [Ensete ventricosum]
MEVRVPTGGAPECLGRAPCESSRQPLPSSSPPIYSFALSRSGAPFLLPTGHMDDSFRCPESGDVSTTVDTSLGFLIGFIIAVTWSAKRNDSEFARVTAVVRPLKYHKSLSIVCFCAFGANQAGHLSHHAWWVVSRREPTLPGLVVELSSWGSSRWPSPAAAVGSLDDGPQLHNTALTLCRCPYAQHDGIPRHPLCNLHHVVFPRASSPLLSLSFRASEAQTSKLRRPDASGGQRW